MNQGFFPQPKPPKLTVRETFVYFSREREESRVRKERGDPWPWSKDPILNAYRFCNVRREDDRVTRWIAANIRKPFADDSTLGLMCCVGRWVNWPDTLRELIVGKGTWPSSPDFTCKALGQALDDRMAKGKKTFGAAYKIPALGTTGSKGKKVGKILAPLWDDRARFERHFDDDPALESTHALLTRYDGFGDFMSYQCLIDMRYTRLLCKADDVDSWCACGPGTTRGLNRLHGRALDAKPPQSQLRNECIELWRFLMRETDIEMDLSDAVNVACEVDKYLRAVNGEGTPKVRYVPGRGA